MKFTNSITIHRRPSEVFAFLSDFENVPRWNYAISETRKITGGPTDVGARYLQTRTVPTRGTETFEVTEFEPDRKLSVRGTFGPFPAEITYVLESGGDGTSLVNVVELQPPGALRLIAPLVTARVKSAVAANLDQLKQILERERSA
jgi:hypothetical protein